MELNTLTDAGCSKHIITLSKVYQDKATTSCTIEDINNQSSISVACGSRSTFAVTTQQNVKHNKKRSSTLTRHSEYAAIMLVHGFCKRISSKG
ncbi:unnamed protein product [Pieris macdunnoughi]|uniref:Uncharacterized protein n=1 Tax=Pieris macdunnoughi TaxID=345717 RepID=A0A821V377_9NEOP|nr:unnamed protein product [Pieris macdunnoughi]